MPLSVDTNIDPHNPAVTEANRAYCAARGRGSVGVLYSAAEPQSRPAAAESRREQQLSSCVMVGPHLEVSRCRVTALDNTADTSLSQHGYITLL